MNLSPMCRLFGQISVVPRTASDYLTENDRSLLAQADARAQDPQKDGWGIAHFEGRKARLVKSPRAVFKEADRFKAAARRARSRVVLAHLRAASDPRGLGSKALISLVNTQPFTDGKWVFCHNGTLQISEEVAKALGPYRKRLKGVNDSEVFFWQLRKFIDLHGDVAEALKACVRETWSLWAGCRARYPKKRSPYTGLNALVSDGEGLYALCHYKTRPGHKALFSAKPWGTMGLALRDGRVVIASEDMDGGPWQQLGSAEVVSARLTAGRITVRRERFSVGPSARSRGAGVA